MHYEGKKQDNHPNNNSRLTNEAQVQASCLDPADHTIWIDWKNPVMKNLLVDPFNLLTGGHASRTIAAHLLTRVGPRWTKELWKSWGGASEQEKKVRDKANIKTWPLRYVCRRYTSSLLENNQLKYIRLMEFERYCNYFPERATTYAKFYTENYEVYRMWWKIIIHQLTKYNINFKNKKG